MYVNERSEHRLVVENRPWLMGGFPVLIGIAAVWAAATEPGISIPGRFATLAFGCLLIGLASHFFPFTRTVFDRRSRCVTHIENRLLGSRCFTLRLSEVEAAGIETEWLDVTHLTRLALQTAWGWFPLENCYGFIDRAPVERAINAWLTPSELTEVKSVYRGRS